MPRMQVEIIFRFFFLLDLFSFLCKKVYFCSVFFRYPNTRVSKKLIAKEIAKKHFLLLLFSLKHEDQLNRVDPSNPSKAIQAEDSAS